MFDAKRDPSHYIHTLTAIVGLIAACCKKPRKGSKKKTAAAAVSPVSPTTPSPETPSAETPSLPPTPLPTRGESSGEGTPVGGHDPLLHPDDPRRRAKGKLAGGLFLALGLLGLVLAAGLGSTDLFRAKRVVR